MSAGKGYLGSCGVASRGGVIRGEGYAPGGTRVRAGGPSLAACILRLCSCSLREAAAVRGRRTRAVLRVPSMQTTTSTSRSEMSMSMLVLVLAIAGCGRCVL